MPAVAAWLGAARAAGEPLPDAMTLATVGPDGWPAARLVMMRGLDHGLVFYTDLGSDKATELVATPRAAAVLHWRAPEHRQVRAVGPTEPVTPAEADAYWAARPPWTRRNATAAHQSRVLSDRSDLERAVGDLEAADPEGRDLPRPDRWSGFRLVPVSVELWQEAPDGLHERVRYRRPPGPAGRGAGAGGGPGWIVERLEP
jgi:pyridoxamine 5'-phosphate oxidase